jgi:hypothetical protein
MENTTGVSGLAHQWARFITHEGYDVVGEVSSDEQLERTQVVFTKPELPETIAGKVLIGQWLNPEVRLEGPSDVYRSDVIVRLGKDARVY